MFAIEVGADTRLKPIMSAFEPKRTTGRGHCTWRDLESDLFRRKAGDFAAYLRFAWRSTYRKLSLHNVGNTSGQRKGVT
jgi:hypothetical protein